MILRAAIIAVALLFGGACTALLPSKIPDDPPPLADMEISLAHAEEPDDEALRTALDPGSFTGIRVRSARLSLDDPEPAGLEVTKIVENSPADAIGLQEDDIVYMAAGPDGVEVDLAWPSQWRKLELDTPPGSEIRIWYDRAGMEREAVITVTARVRPPARPEPQRYRENRRVGIVLRNATEVEARAAGLGPGGGAIVVGLARSSPWRKAGLVYGDLIVRVAGQEVGNPQVVLDQIKMAEEAVAVEYVREGATNTVTAGVSRREREVKEVYIPILYDYEKDGDRREISILLGLFGMTKTPVAGRYRILWFITWSTGDADLLKEVDS